MTDEEKKSYKVVPDLCVLSATLTLKCKDSFSKILANNINYFETFKHCLAHIWTRCRRAN